MGLSRVLLTITNGIFFLIGLLVTVFFGLALFGMKKADIFTNVGDLSTLATLFFALGIFVLIVSGLGLFGACCRSKFLLFIYTAVVVVLFLITGIMCLVLFLKNYIQVEQELSRYVATKVDTLNNSTISPTIFNKECNDFKSISILLNCCGYNSSTDFTDASTVEKCCKTGFEKNLGCNKAVLDKYEKFSSYLKIPTVIVLIAELLAILMAGSMIATKRYSEDYD